MGNGDHKQVIIDEIKHWKQSKLLPAEYCDFLLALYTYGEGVEESTEPKQRRSHHVFFYIDIVLLLLLLPLSLILMIVYQFGMALDILIYTVILLVISFHIYWYKRKSKSLIHIPIMLFFLVLLISTISIIHSLYGQGFVLNTAVIFHCLLWIVTGFVFRYHYLIASGFIGVILFMIFIFL
ncbi:hypothetical protein [Alkalibacillus silvisoli]|uniref:DUF1700 domain-containing protein n=1 Tax=Alkalibacillus silvisoli TaxID=392823 RepID=A0ABP3JLF3_9BACI